MKQYKLLQHKSIITPEQRKQFEDHQEVLQERQESLNNLIAELEVNIGEKQEIDWDELRDYDPCEYIKQKETQ